MTRKLETLEDYERAIAHGYGLGFGNSYKPWLRVKDVPSRGRSGKHRSLTVGRIHQTLSDLETRTLFLADFCEEVTDIREQFPIIPMDSAQLLAKNLGINYPKHPKSKIPIVLTTDFLLTLKNKGKPSYLAISVKPTSELKKRRVCELLDLERVYWQSLGIDWKLATEYNLSEEIHENLVWISAPLKSEEKTHLEEATFIKISKLIPPGRHSINSILEVVGKNLRVSEHEAKYILCSAIWHKKLEIDLSISVERTGLTLVKSWKLNAINSEVRKNDIVA